MALERAAEEEVQCLPVRDVVGFADLVLEAVGFEREELFFERAVDGGGDGLGGRRECAGGGFAEEEAGGDGHEESEAAEDPPLVFGPGIVVGVGVDGLAHAAAEFGGVGVAVGVGLRGGVGVGGGLAGAAGGALVGVLGVAGELAGAGEGEGEGLLRGDVAGDEGLRVDFVGDGGEGGLRAGGEGHRLRQHEGDGVGGEGRVECEGDVAGVGEAIGDLEAGFAGADGEVEGVVIFFGERHRGGLDGHAAGGECGGAFDDGAFREGELEGLFGELGGGRCGLVLDEEVFYDAETVAVGLDAEDVRFADDAFDFGGGVVDVELDGLGARRRGAEVGGLIVRDADEVDAGVGDFEGEAAACVSFGAGGFLHALLETDEDDVVVGRGLVGGAVGNDAGERILREGGGGGEDEKWKKNSDAHT